MVKDSEAAEKLVFMAIELGMDDGMQQELSKNIAPLGITNADERIAAEIYRLL